MTNEQANLLLCACGCNEILPIPKRSWGPASKFINGHQHRKHPLLDRDQVKSGLTEAQRKWISDYLKAGSIDEGDCRIWHRRKPGCYGSARIGGVYFLAHQWAFLASGGVIKNELFIDHLCRNKRCIKREHLEQVLPRINVIRGISPSAMNLRKTHCIRGHVLEGSNLKITEAGYRICKACRRIHWSAANEERKRIRHASR